MDGRFLNQIDLSNLWKMSHRTLERWRCEGRGPSYVKIGGKVLYRAEDILAFENSGLKTFNRAGPFENTAIVVTRTFERLKTKCGVSNRPQGKR